MFLRQVTYNECGWYRKIFFCGWVVWNAGEFTYMLLSIYFFYVKNVLRYSQVSQMFFKRDVWKFRNIHSKTLVF